MSKAYRAGDLLPVKIEKIVPRGLGLAFAEDLTVFVPLAAPGDELDVRLVEVKRRTAFAEIVSIRKPGPDRVAPPCPYFGTCGGCDFQQLSYQAQLAAKVEIIADCLRRIGRIDPLPEIGIVPCPAPLQYRARARWQIGDGKVGYFSRNSHTIVDIESCPILTDGLNSALQDIRQRHLSGPGPRRLEVDAAEGDNGSLSLATRGGGRPELLAYSTGENGFTYSARTFFQANKFLIKALTDAAVGNASGEKALDLYCGVGLFTLPLAMRFQRVVGVEENAEAASFCKLNLKDAGLDNARVETGSVIRYLSKTTRSRPDFILLDPPRIGTKKGAISSLISLAPKFISYVSCEPSILARDLRQILDGGYQIESIVALDMFPQTHHVETVVRLRRGTLAASRRVFSP